MDFSGNGANDVRVIRAPSLKRGKTDERLSDRIKLKKVLGLTVYSNAALDVSPTTGVLAYPAGCTGVLFNPKKHSQTFLLNTSKKAITAVSYSRCGRYLATGECGQNPQIKVWELDQNTTNGTINGGTVVAEFPGHKYAVACIAFSPTGKYLVSVGSQHDMIVNVFDWKSNLKIASNKVSAKVVAVSFCENGNYFVTVGNRHVKYWYLEGNNKYKEPIPLMGRSAILGELRNNDFCAVVCGKEEMSDSTYAITRTGQLVEFNSRRLLDKWVACRTTSANCIASSGRYILVGCAEAIVRVFNAQTLEYVTTLPRTHYLGVDVAQGIQINHIMSAPKDAKYPDTIAMVYDEPRAKVTCVYNDHSLYIWDLRDIRRTGKSHSYLFHSACIWGVETVPFGNMNRNQNPELTFPSDCFLTCSSDDTIRVWGLDGCENNDVYRKNLYSKELLKVAYIDDELNFIKDNENPILNMEKSTSYDARNGVRCMKISPELNQLATGDRSGNIRIYNVNSFKLVTTIEAHDSEVLCLEYTNDKIDKKLLASASRDRLIHVFDVSNGYSILQTLDDHSSSITSVKFIGSGLNFQMISCGADKAIIFRTYQNNQFSRGTNCSGKTTLYDMEVDSNYKHILTACQDRNIRVYGTQNGKHTKTFKGSHSDEGTLIKLTLDLSGIYVATSCTDKTLSVYDYYSSECMARMYGHSELVTGLKFTNDCKHLISASGDGCVFIWQVPHDMMVTMQARLSQQALRSGNPNAIARPIAFGENFAQPQSIPERKISPINRPEIDITSPSYKLAEVGQLPQWAKRKTPMDESQNAQMSSLGTSPNQVKARGKWAQKGTLELDHLSLGAADEPSTYHGFTPKNNGGMNNNQTSDYNSSSSKDVYNNLYLSEDSSIDSGMENKKDLFLHKMAIEQKSNQNSLNFESTTEHDGDIEDISDGERTSSEHGLMFYQEGSGTPTSDFTVNAMDEEELRKSVRRQKIERQGLTLTPTSQGTHSTGPGTGTSDDDEDGSTPSGDNAERSLASTLGGSSENIPRPSVASFTQVALDGPGTFGNRSDRSRRSISAKHNTDIKTNPSSSLSKTYTSSKKEELMKVINEAKAKLENVGYRSNLRSSRSISDLSHSANMENNFRGNRAQRPTGIPISFMSPEMDESSIRRACSLSDLSMGKGMKPTNGTTSYGSKPSPATRTSLAAPRNVPRRSVSFNKPGSSGMGSRSVSVGILNQTDSDQDSNESEQQRGGLMKPTISSYNKSSASPNRPYVNPRSAAGIISRRKGMANAHSSINISTISARDDSSSEETLVNSGSGGSKPMVPPRPRNIPQEKRTTSSPSVTSRRPISMNDGSSLESPTDSDLANPNLSKQICFSVISKLTTTTKNVLELYERLRISDDSTESRNRMLEELENAAKMTRKALTKITNNREHMDIEMSGGRKENGDYSEMMDKCNDIINRVQKQVQNGKEYEKPSNLS